jgi:hypothetical protein
MFALPSPRDGGATEFFRAWEVSAVPHDVPHVRARQSTSTYSRLRWLGGKSEYIDWIHPSVHPVLGNGPNGSPSGGHGRSPRGFSPSCRSCARANAHDPARRARHPRAGRCSISRDPARIGCGTPPWRPSPPSQAGMARARPRVTPCRPKPRAGRRQLVKHPGNDCVAELGPTLASHRFGVPYSWSVTCSSQVTTWPWSSASCMAMWAMKRSGVAPCQCSSPGSM